MSIFFSNPSQIQLTRILPSSASHFQSDVQKIQKSHFPAANFQKNEGQGDRPKPEDAPRADTWKSSGLGPDRREFPEGVSSVTRRIGKFGRPSRGIFRRTVSFSAGMRKASFALVQLLGRLSVFNASSAAGDERERAERVLLSFATNPPAVERGWGWDWGRERGLDTRRIERETHKSSTRNDLIQSGTTTYRQCVS